MRPTFLRYRSPKEKTGEFVNTPITYTGFSLTPAPIYPRAKSTFPRGKRFEHIEEMTRRTGYRVGPGCYDYAISTNKGISANIRPDSAVPSNQDKEVEYVYVNHSIFKQEVSHPRHKTQALAGTRTSFGGTPIKGWPEPESLMYNPPHIRSRRLKPSQQLGEASFMEPTDRSPAMNRSTTEGERSLSARRVIRKTENLRVSVGDGLLKRPGYTSNRIKIRRSQTNRTSELSNILNQTDFTRAFNASTRTTSPRPCTEIDTLRKSLNLTKVYLD